MRKRLACLVCGLFLTSCVVLTSVSVDSVIAKNGPKATGEASGRGYFGLSLPDVNLLEVAALGKIQGQGAVKNVTIRLEMRNWFGIVQVYKVIATGEKIPPAKVKSDVKAESKGEIKGDAKPPVTEP